MTGGRGSWPFVLWAELAIAAARAAKSGMAGLAGPPPPGMAGEGRDCCVAPFIGIGIKSVEGKENF